MQYIEANGIEPGLGYGFVEAYTINKKCACRFGNSD
jgi:hypothetical protein